MPKQDNYANRRQFALQGLEKIVSSHDKFFIDTCSIMSAYMPLFAENIIPVLIKHNKKLSVCSSVIRELKKLSHPIGTSVSGELYAYMGLCTLDRFIDNNLLEYVEDNVYDGPADLAFQQVFLTLRREHRLLLITQDADLTDFVLNYNNNASVWGKPIEIKYINSYGFLSARTEAATSKPQQPVNAPAKSRPGNKQQNSASNSKKPAPQQQKPAPVSPKKQSFDAAAEPTQSVTEVMAAQSVAQTTQYASDSIAPQSVTQPAQHISDSIAPQSVTQSIEESAAPQEVYSIPAKVKAFSDCPSSECFEDDGCLVEDIDFSMPTRDTIASDFSGTPFEHIDTENQDTDYSQPISKPVVEPNTQPVKSIAEVPPQKKSPFSYSFTEKDAQNHISDNKLYVPMGYTSVGFTNSPHITTAYLPDTVKNINSQAFRDCRQLSRIVLPSTLETIGQSAFLNCSSLLSITIPSGVSVISNGVFKNCTRLRLVNLNTTLTSIGSSAFAGCSSLGIITIPKSVNYIAKNAFTGCKSLVIQCYENSFAHCFAYENKLPFDLIG